MKALDLYERGLGQHEPTGGQSDRPRAGGIDLDQKAMTTERETHREPGR